MDTLMGLIFKVRIERLITERESMIALNQFRINRGETIAYDEDAFLLVAQQFTDIETDIRNKQY